VTLKEHSSLWEFRSFLYNELRLTELYTGTGYTQTPDGAVGVAEYFIVNQPLENLGALQVIDLNRDRE
jgi:hypothetical protein